MEKMYVVTTSPTRKKAFWGRGRELSWSRCNLAFILFWRSK
jgi:hypothetical protein